MSYLMINDIFSITLLAFEIRIWKLGLELGFAIGFEIRNWNQRLKFEFEIRVWSSTCALRGFFWFLSHVIYLKLITRVSSFPSFNFWMINYTYTQKSYLALWQNCFVKFISQKFPSLKSKHFSQFFLVRGKSERIDKI